ncbi:substrate-binding domain-containing protein [Xanthobacter sp. KR7-225]|uniref:substrate-binding domain-containing protein n=1 Tax=Xanthobacter sp. KR7-225 TaxID=3156613 RepID=UPI0032B31F9F
MRTRLCAVLLICLSAASARAEEIRLVAAGSLTGAFNAMIADYGRTHPKDHIATRWGPSGVLRTELEHGGGFDIFASAALPHAQALTEKGIASDSVLFARNALCAIALADGPALASDTLVGMLLKPETRLATSTPKADPGGDYTWELFALIDQQHPGAFAALSGKAQQVFGGATTTGPLNGRHRLAVVLGDKGADVAIYYCSGTQEMSKAEPGRYKVVALPRDLAVGPEYGLTLANTATLPAADFAMYILSPAGQKTLADFGFIPVTLPTAR